VPPYQARWLRSDLLARIRLGTYALHEGVAYTSLASLLPQLGIYDYLLGGVGYALFGSSRHLAIGPTSAISRAWIPRIWTALDAVVGGYL
jgi:MFS superfamily sulfate permease-like transporter